VSSVPTVTPATIPSQPFAMPKFNRMGNGLDRKEDASTLEKFGRATAQGVMSGLGFGSLPSQISSHPVYGRMFS